MKNKPILYWKGSALNDEDFSELAEEFKISYDLVAEAVAQIKAKGEPLYAQYSGTARERIRNLASQLSFDNKQEEDEEPVPKKPAKGKPAPKEEAKEEPVEEKAENDTEIDSDESEPAPLTEEQVVVSEAAVSLIQAMADNEKGHFIIHRDGCCEVNPESPPEITHAYQVVSNVLKLRDLAPVVDDKSSWMLGSFVASLEEYFGEDFSISQVCDINDQSYNTIAQKVAVFKRFKKKRYNLTYSHHQQVHYTKIRKDKEANKKSQELILSKAESYKISCKDIRSLCSIAKKMDDDQVIKNIRSHDQAIALIDAYKTNKVLYLVYDEGGWTRVSGLAGQRPQGKVVIDTKEWKAWVGAESVDIPKQ